MPVFPRLWLVSGALAKHVLPAPCGTDPRIVPPVPLLWLQPGDASPAILACRRADGRAAWSLKTMGTHLLDPSDHLDRETGIGRQPAKSLDRAGRPPRSESSASALPVLSLKTAEEDMRGT